MPLTIDIPHGGSGHGITGWIETGIGCLIAHDLAENYTRTCTSKALLVGTMVHEYLRLWRSDQIDAQERVAFIDTTCDIEIDQEWQDEAHRIFSAYCDLRAKDAWGPIAGVEVHLSGEQVEDAVGVSPYTAQIDLLAGRKRVKLIDYKTAAASGNRYATGKTRLQMTAYWLAATAAGYHVDEIWIEQITKTKKVKVNLYQIDIPSPAQISELRRYLAYAKKRKTCGQRVALLPYCDSCTWKQSGLCLGG